MCFNSIFRKANAKFVKKVEEKGKYVQSRIFMLCFTA